jgi:hypothetical protein
MVCEPEVSTTRLTAAEGQPCGSAATECSAQDTCDAEGRCEPNHLEGGAPCGAPTPDLCGLPAQASVCQPVFNQCDDSGEITFIGIPCH